MYQTGKHGKIHEQAGGRCCLSWTFWQDSLHCMSFTVRALYSGLIIVSSWCGALSAYWQELVRASLPYRLPASKGELMRKRRTDREIVYSILTEVMGGAKDQLNDDMLLGDWLGVAGDSIPFFTFKIFN